VATQWQVGAASAWGRVVQSCSGEVVVRAAARWRSPAAACSSLAGSGCSGGAAPPPDLPFHGSIFSPFFLLLPSSVLVVGGGGQGKEGLGFERAASGGFIGARLGFGGTGAAQTLRNGGGLSAWAGGRMAHITRLCGAGLGLGRARGRPVKGEVESWARAAWGSGRQRGSISPPLSQSEASGSKVASGRLRGRERGTGRSAERQAPAVSGSR